MKKLADNSDTTRVLQGTVVSDGNSGGTVVVRVERRFTHPVIKKTVRRSRKYADWVDDRPVGRTEDGVAILAPVDAPTHLSRGDIRAAIEQLRNTKPAM